MNLGNSGAFRASRLFSASRRKDRGILPQRRVKGKGLPEILAMLASCLQLRVAPVSPLTLCPPPSAGAKGVIDTPF